jgi:hypothetical protein
MNMQKNTTFLTISAFFLLFLASFSVQAQVLAEDAPYVFKELRGLEGTWFMPTDRGDRLEIWTYENDSTLTGRGIRIRPENGDTVTLETMRLELRDTTITYYATVRGQNRNQAVPFVLVNADTEGFVFSNPKHDDPQKIHYRLLGNRELQVNTEGMRNGRKVSQEFVFEREFNPSSVEFRLKAGLNYNTLSSSGQFQTFEPPVLGGKPGWDIGMGMAFQGRGGFLTLNVEMGVTGRYTTAKAEFTDDTVFYRRDLTYRQIWFTAAFMPELRFGKNGKLSFMAGPYYNRLMFSGLKGLNEPGDENKLFEASNDFVKSDIGVTGGFQYRVNFGKKDLDGRLGLRVNIGLKNLDNLYDRGCNNPAFCNGQIIMRGISLYYSVNMLKI